MSYIGFFFTKNISGKQTKENGVDMIWIIMLIGYKVSSLLYLYNDKTKNW